MSLRPVVLIRVTPSQQALGENLVEALPALCDAKLAVRPTAGEPLSAPLEGLDEVDFVLLVFSSSDLAQATHDRDQSLLELGLCLGRFGSKRTLLAHPAQDPPALRLADQPAWIALPATAPIAIPEPLRAAVEQYGVRQQRRPRALEQRLLARAESATRYFQDLLVAGLANQPGGPTTMQLRQMSSKELMRSARATHASTHYQGLVYISSGLKVVQSALGSKRTLTPREQEQLMTTVESLHQRIEQLREAGGSPRS